MGQLRSVPQRFLRPALSPRPPRPVGTPPQSEISCALLRTRLTNRLWSRKLTPHQRSHDDFRRAKKDAFSKPKRLSSKRAVKVKGLCLRLFSASSFHSCRCKKITQSLERLLNLRKPRSPHRVRTTSSARQWRLQQNHPVSPQRIMATIHHLLP